MRRNIMFVGLANYAKAIERRWTTIVVAVAIIGIGGNGADYAYRVFVERPANEAAEIARNLESQTQILREEQCQMERVTNALALKSQPGDGVITLADLADANRLAREAADELEVAENAYLSAKRASNGGLPVGDQAIGECYGAIIAYSPVIYGLRARIATIECEAYLAHLVAEIEQEEKLTDGLLVAAAYSEDGTIGVQPPDSLLQSYSAGALQAEFKKVETVLKDRQPFLSRQQIDFYQSLLNRLRQKIEQFHPSPATQPTGLLASHLPA